MDVQILAQIEWDLKQLAVRTDTLNQRLPDMIEYSKVSGILRVNSCHMSPHAMCGQSLRAAGESNVSGNQMEAG